MFYYGGKYIAIDVATLRDGYVHSEGLMTIALTITLNS